MTISATNPEGALAERFGTGGAQSPPVSDSAPAPAPKNKGGRPKGSKTKTRTAASQPEPVKTLTVEEQEQGAAMCAFLTATIWDIAAPMLKRRSLTDVEAERLGKALFPVLNKYLPALGDWQMEINLLLVVATLWSATAIPESELPRAETSNGANRLEMTQ